MGHKTIIPLLHPKYYIRKIGKSKEAPKDNPAYSSALYILTTTEAVSVRLLRA